MILELEVKSILDREVSCAQKLLQVLGQEYDALLSADISAIEQVTAEKQKILGFQDDLARARQNMILRTSFADTEQGLRELISTCENRDQLSESLAQLTTIINKCHAANRANGRLIMRNRHRAQAALNILRQSDVAMPTYSGEGVALSSSGTRSLGKA